MKFDQLGNTAVIGLQWGDEGKGKVVDLLMEHFDVSVRYSGGANAGHTVVIGGEKFALHQLPSGILRGEVACVIAGGAVIDPAMLLGEIASLEQRGIAVRDQGIEGSRDRGNEAGNQGSGIGDQGSGGATGWKPVPHNTGSRPVPQMRKLSISDRAHVVFPWHRREDVLAEKAAREGAKLGTTARGIGPCYADKISRHWGIRICDLLSPGRLRERVATVCAYKNAIFQAVYEDREGAFDSEKIAAEYAAFGEQLTPYIADTTVLLHDLIKAGKRILFEGAQGSLLDIDHGTYPYVTAASAAGGGVASGAGVPISAIGATLGVVKAYSTRVGAGPMPTELLDVTGDTIRERGHEYGTTTGRARRCGWFDAVAAGYAARIAGPTHLAILHLDTLSGFNEVRVCVGYRMKGIKGSIGGYASNRDQGIEVVHTLPADTYRLESAEPVYETLRGWSEDLGACRSWGDLPPAAREYVTFISEILETPVGLIGVGPGREQTIFIAD